MPLVSIDRIKTWYVQDSWVYRSFKYLFVNELWTKKVPNGASVCPYFWAALFSLLIFRPAVWGALGLKWLIKTARVGKVVRFVDRLITGKEFTESKDYVVGVPTFVICVILFLSSLLSYVMYLLGCDMYKAGMLPYMLLTGLFIISTILCAILDGNTPKSDVINPRIALWSISTLIVACLVTFQHDLFIGGLNEIQDIVGLFWWVICEAASVVWSFVYGCLSYIGYFIWGCGATVVALWKWYVATIVIWVIAMCILYRYNWSREYIHQYHMDFRLHKIRKTILSEIARLQATRFDNDYDVPYGYKWWLSRITKSHVAYDIICQIVDSTAWLKVDLKYLSASISPERMDQIGDAVLAEYEAEEAADKRTEILNRRLTAIKTWWKKTYLYYWLSCAAKGSHWLFKQIAAFVSLLWEIIKSKKRGACPYMQFVQNQVDNRADNH